MHQDEKDAMKGTAIMVSLIWLIIMLTSWLIYRVQWRNEAVEQGHAEYYLTTDHKKEWRWLEEK